MWDHEGILRDLRILLNNSCVDEALAACATLSALAPVREVVDGTNESVRPYILRKFLQAVVDGAQADDETTKAAGALIGVYARPGREKGLRWEDAGVIIKRSKRTVRRPENETALLKGLRNAITDFVGDPDRVGRFVQTHRAWLESRPSGHVSSIEENVASPATPPRPKAAQESVDSEKLGLADILRALSLTADKDPIAHVLLAKIKGALSVDDHWMERVTRLHFIQQRANGLGSRLLSYVQVARAERSDPDSWRSSYSVRADIMLIQSDFQLLHADLSMFMMSHGYLWLLGDSEIEQEARDSVRAIYRLAPFYPDNDTWLTELLTQPQAGREVVSIKRGLDMPPMPGGREAERPWQQLLAECQCQTDGRPEPDCRVHALIHACNRYSRAAQAVLTHHLEAHTSS